MHRTHNTLLSTLALLTLSGCEQIADLQETVNGLTNPLVGQGLVIGVEPPDSDSGIDLSQSNFSQNAWAELYLADAASVDDMGDAPVTGATASLSSASNGSLALGEAASGRYTIDEDGGLVYGLEATTLSVDLEDGSHSMVVTAPDAPDAALATTHGVNTPLDVDLTGQGFDSTLVVVFDVASFEVTFSNEPEDIGALYEFSHGGNGSTVEVPATAFTEQTLYAVGVAGLVNAEAADLTELNTALSGMMAGKFRFYPVSTLGN
jgi:hypothetical protein